MATNQSITCSVNSPNTRKRSPHNGKADNHVSSNIVPFTSAGNSALVLHNRKVTPRRLPNAALQTFEDVGHNMKVEIPDLLAGHTLRFISQVEADEL